MRQGLTQDPNPGMTAHCLAFTGDFKKKKKKTKTENLNTKLGLHLFKEIKVIWINTADLGLQIISYSLIH